MDTVTIVVPCFNEQEALPYFYKEYLSINKSMTYAQLELLFIDDGSNDETLHLIQSYAEIHPEIKLYNANKNFEYF